MLTRPLAALSALWLLISPCATADIRRQGSEVDTVTYEGIVANVYPDRSLWLLLPDRGESLFLKTDGAAVHYDDMGRPIGEGRWDADERGNVRGLQELSGTVAQKVNRTLAHLRRRPARKAGTGPPAPTDDVERNTEIEWVGP